MLTSDCAGTAAKRTTNTANVQNLPAHHRSRKCRAACSPAAKARMDRQDYIMPERCLKLSNKVFSNCNALPVHWEFSP